MKEYEAKLIVATTFQHELERITSIDGKFTTGFPNVDKLVKSPEQVQEYLNLVEKSGELVTLYRQELAGTLWEGSGDFCWTEFQRWLESGKRITAEENILRSVGVNQNSQRYAQAATCVLNAVELLVHLVWYWTNTCPIPRYEEEKINSLLVSEIERLVKSL